MNLAIPDGQGGFHTFTNERIEVGDEVYPLIDGWSHNGEWYLVGAGRHDTDDPETMLACTGWPDEPHKVLEIIQPTKDEPARIRTDHGYSPAECYFWHTGHVKSTMPNWSHVECSECRFDITCKLKKNKKDGCSFYGPKKGDI